MQPCRLTLGCGNDHAGIGPCYHGLGEFSFHCGGISREGAIDDWVNLQLGGVGNDRHHVVERDLALAVGVERETRNSLREAWRSPPSRAISTARASGAIRRLPRHAAHRRSVLQVRVRRRDSRRWRRRSGPARRPCAAGGFGPEFACLYHDAAVLQRRLRQCINSAGKTPRARRVRELRGGRRTAAPSTLHRPGATARLKAHRRPASPVKTDRWDHRPLMPAARRRVRAPDRHRDHRAG